MAQTDDTLNRTDFQQIARERLADANTLLAAGQYAGAYYIGGYAIECALKACVAKLTKEGDFPPRANRVADSYYTHDLRKLLGAAQLGDLMEARGKADANFADKWTIVTRWKEDRRYQIGATVTQSECEEFLMAINDPKNGVFLWLQAQW